MLHDFYTFVENIAKTVAMRIDGHDWHRELLEQMNPRTLSAALVQRHSCAPRQVPYVFRNIYGFQPDADRTLELVCDMHKTVSALNSDLDCHVREIDRITRWKPEEPLATSGERREHPPSVWPCIGRDERGMTSSVFLPHAHLNIGTCRCDYPITCSSRMSTRLSKPRQQNSRDYCRTYDSCYVGPHGVH